MKKAIVIACVVYMVQAAIMSFGSSIGDTTGAAAHITAHLEQVK
jgi:hypothetical protein